MKDQDQSEVRRIEPLMVAEPVAADMLDESYETRRRRRYDDQKRLERGEPIEGPPWIQDGGRIKYRVRDIEDYVNRRVTCLVRKAGAA